MASEKSEPGLQDLRQEINRIDGDIVRLIDERARVVRQVGELKKHSGAPVFRPERENVVLKRAADASKELPAASVHAIFREILSSCRALEEKLRVAYLGPRGTFSEMVVLSRFGSAVRTEPCTNIPDAFRMAENRRADYAVVPIENSTQGTVSITFDQLLSTPLTIVGEVSVPVIHNLLTKNGTLEGIRRVAAHPQALAQCRGWLSEHLPGAELSSVSSNAEGARLASLDPATGAIAALRAADIYGLEAAAEGIQDWAGNRTRFLVLGHEATHRSSPPLRDKTTFEFSVRNKAGALFEVLELLAREHVSMTHLESRPARNGAWEYNFFVDVEGHIEDEPVRKALSAVKENSAIFKFLGSYPAAE